MAHESKDRTDVNYFYFLSLFLFLLFLTLSHFLRLSQPILGVSLFFLLYALGQSLLEVLLLMLIGYSLHSWAPRWAFKTFIGLSFAFLLAQFANFTMVRLMDAPLSYALKFFFGSSVDHLKAAFYALNLNRSMVAIIVGSTFVVPLAGIAFYWITQKASLKKPLALTQRQIFGAAVCLSLLLLALDITAQPHLNESLHRKYRKTLPLGSTFLAPKAHSLALEAPLRILSEEPKELPALFSKEKPNVYLFVIETLRKDFITPSIAPNLCSLNLDQTELTFSNANGTYLSWFSIFHSIYPWHWTRVRDNWHQGSIPLRLFKKMGYRIHAISSADLVYFGINRVLFGDQNYLLDSLDDFSALSLETCERDRLAMQALASHSEKSGNLFLIFLDSTHSEYSSPEDSARPFRPYASKVDYLSISADSNDLELLKNRYRNAIHWIDHLLGEFFDQLKSQGDYETAVCAITGDHGEEFFEEGALFHGTHLNDWQTRVPLLYKIPNRPLGPLPSLSTHLDIFPTILHSLSGQDDLEAYFDGKSIFSKGRTPFAITVQHNGPDVPYEFTLFDENARLWGRFLNPPSIHSVPAIELLNVENRSALSEEDLLSKFTGYFDFLIEK